MKTSTEELLAFVTVVNTGSFTAAADQLGQTVSGISRSMSRLEEKLATTLLHRTTRRLALTEEGELFLAQARQILAAIEDAEEQILLRRQRPGGTLRINAASPYMRHVLLPVIGAFRARYPEIRLVLNTSEDLIDLIEQRTDLAFRIGTLSDSSLHARSLGQYRLRILAAPAYLEKYGWPLQASDLPHHQLIGFSQPESLNDWPLQHDVQQSYRIQPALTASNGEIVRELALAGEGIACLADFMTGEDRRSGRLVQVLEPVTREFFQPVNAVYYRHTELSARIRVFLDFLSHSLAVNEDKLAPAR